MKSFEKWGYDEVEEQFGVVHQKDLPLLIEWLSTTHPINDQELHHLKLMQTRLQNQVNDWNEAELAANFIHPLFYLVDYLTPYYQPFWQRNLQATINDIKLHGVVDFLLASGKRKPKEPYFCLHEYKPTKGFDNDPLGQLLCAMLCAQAQNSHIHQPIYGVYVIGRLWYFVVLIDKTYSVSLPFDASQEGLFRIFSALKYLKTLLNNLILERNSL